MRYKYTKEIIEILVKDSLTIADVCRGLGIKSCGGNYKTLKNKFKEWEINTSHFLGQAHNQGVKFIPFGQKYKLEDILIENSPYNSSNNLKRRLYNEGILLKKCYECGIEEWNGKEISFELDHINGVNNDNRIQNLRILCPNCHSQTDTFRGKNIK